jgi:metal-dependent amidase/aminoacylase/carboxypeptidase family protein
MGNIAYGISPGRAQMGITVRSSDDEELSRVVGRIQRRVVEVNEKFDGEIAIKQIEPFSATINDDFGTELVVQTAERIGLEVQNVAEPFPWSEDFGEFRKKCPITLFGLGTGENHPPLHSELYDFNDNLIATGVKLFAELSTL